MPIKIATWNVNSIKVRQDHLETWLSETAPDIAFLQELKLPTEDFPTERFENVGYTCHVHGQKTYNGVAILSKIPLEIISTNILDNDEQARFIHAYAPDHNLHMINVYCPNGNPVDSEKYPYKKEWMASLFSYAKDLIDDGKKVLIGGDFNIIPQPEDCYNPQEWQEDALFRPETRQIWRRFLNIGFYDAYRALHPSTNPAYTFWDYQAGRWHKDQGIRIDHFLLSGSLVDQLENAEIDKKPRGWEKPSDHTPFVIKV